MLKTKVNQALKYVSYLFRSDTSLAKPTIFQIESTNHCPMNCVMCPRQYMKRKKGFMDFALFKKIVDQLNGYMGKTEFIRLHHFGDPLVHPEIGKFIDYAHDNGLKVSISVNPILLTNSISNNIIRSKIDQIQISLDGVDDETYKQIRGKAADYKIAENNIRNFVNLKLEKRKLNLRVIVGIVLMDATKELINEFKKRWTIDGVDKVMVKSFSAFGNKDLLGLGDETSRNHITKYALKHPCYWPWRDIVVLWDGRVVPCCWDYDGKVVLGDLNKQTLKEIWNGENMKELRKQHINKDFGDNLFCGKCVERYGAPGIKEPVALLKFGLRKIIWGNRNS